MSVAAADARSAAAEVVARVLRDRVTLEAACAARAGPAALGPAVRSLSYGAVRGYYRHEALLERLLSQPVASLDARVRALLSIALFELEDGLSPEYAVVHAAVSLAKRVSRAGPLVNAVLRRYLRERQALDAEIAASPAARYAAPAWLAQRLKQDWPSRWIDLLAAGDRQAPMWLRVDSRHATADAYVATLRAAGIEARAEPRVPQAVVLQAPREVGELPGFAEGRVSVQDLGAQCVAFPLALAAGQRVLDACAAPGGKTSLIAERAPELGGLVAVDIDRERLERVRENLDRGHLRAELVAADAAAPEGWWDGRPFDRILLDAPCSALGVIRRHPDIRLRRSPEDIEHLSAIQSRLLASLWGLLARGGRLVYATCTLTRRENGGVIGAFLERAKDAQLVSVDEWHGWPGLGEGDAFGRQILLGEAGADGFYYAALTKQ
ncbi:MAG TPA: 16S rRNA (cytosine(967)-C(5))-methyltransferase RsmB [Steroidobacteraceae bacterium]|nr:16S rRNA (cytosine(967)-C(5))-methyltransferase RsmB [Steroidobacteraceae bacterium]